MGLGQVAAGLGLDMIKSGWWDVVVLYDGSNLEDMAMTTVIVEQLGRRNERDFRDLGPPWLECIPDICTNK